ncbi:MAG: undecaprenyl-diphosphate phosphatase [Acidimicrobiia bacterium]
MLVALLVTPAGASVTTATIVAAQSALSFGQAILFGLVEGFTEFLPISSTGHLLVLARVLDVGQHGKSVDAIKSYEIAIQSGAILAVLGLYRHRFATMIEGLTGRSDDGRRVLIGVAIAFVPAAIVGVVFESKIKDILFGVGPVLAAWVVGGILILVLTRMGILAPRGGRVLEQLTPRHALVIGLAQVLSLWPGTSRSLVTIVAALLLGYSMAAAVEFSFLLGFVTLGAATGYQVLKDGDTMIKAFGWGTALVGLLAAFVGAAVSIKWMVSYLQRHDLSIFGWYRLAIAAIVGIALISHTI